MKLAPSVAVNGFSPPVGLPSATSRSRPPRRGDEDPDAPAPTSAPHPATPATPAASAPANTVRRRTPALIGTSDTRPLASLRTDSYYRERFSFLTRLFG